MENGGIFVIGKTSARVSGHGKVHVEEEEERRCRRGKRWLSVKMAGVMEGTGVRNRGGTNFKVKEEILCH